MIPSLSNPPNAPKKQRIRRPKPYQLQRIPRLRLPTDEEKRTKNEWQWLRDCGHVRAKFLTYTPEDIAEIDSIDFLTDMLERCNPSSQTHNIFEEAYLSHMRDAVLARLYML